MVLIEPHFLSRIICTNAGWVREGRPIRIPACRPLPKINSTKSNQIQDWQKSNLDLWNQINSAHLLQKKLIPATANSIKPNLKQNMHKYCARKSKSTGTHFGISSSSECDKSAKRRFQLQHNFPRSGCFYVEPREPAVKSARNVRLWSIPGRTPPSQPGGPFVQDLWPASYGGGEGMSETYAGRQVMVKTWVA